MQTRSAAVLTGLHALPKTLVIFACVLLTVGCELTSSDAQCSAVKACPRGMACDLGYGLCHSVPPEIEIESPTDRDFLTESVVRVRGTVTDNLKVSNLFFRMGESGEWSPLGWSGIVFDAVLPLPELDGSSLPISLLARDELGAETLVTVSPRVDNQGPRLISVTPADLERAAPPKLKLQFSEPVLPTGNGLVITPSAPGAPLFFNTASTSLEVDLERGTFYTVQLRDSAFADAAGNRMHEERTLRFYTAVRTPLEGTTVDFAPSTVLGMDAVADTDGVVSLVVKLKTAEGVRVQWGRIHPVTGRYEKLNVATALPDSTFRAAGGVSVNRGGRPTRVSGFTLGLAADLSTWSAHWRVDDEALALPLTGGTPFLLPITASCAEEASGPLAFIQAEAGQPVYARLGGPWKAPLDFFPWKIGIRSSDAWEFIDVKEGHLRRQRAQAFCEPPAKLSFRFAGSLASNVATSPAPDLVLTRWDRSLYVYSTNNGERWERCEPCVYSSELEGCVAAEVRTLFAVDLKVTSRNAEGRVLGAHRLSQTEIAVAERDLGPSCVEPWKRIGTVRMPEPILDFTPLMFGERPGVLLQFEQRVQVAFP